MKTIRDYLLVRSSDLFDREYYLHRNPDVQKAGVDPILHYLRTGWQEGRNPSADFKMDNYFQLNPDVKATGMNPLVHYLRLGRKEGRILNHPDLYFHYLGMQVDPTGKKDISCLLDPLAEIPAEPASSQTFKQNHPALQFRKLASQQSPQLIFDQSGSGGAKEFTRLQIMNEKLVFLLNNMDADGNYLLAVVSEGNVITAYTLSQLSQIEKLVEAFGIRSIVINELVSYPQVFTILDFLLELKNRNPDLEFTYYLHDFYCVCPSYTLIDHSLSYCGIPQDLSYCDNCLRTHPMKDEFYAVINRDYPGLTMQRWRSEFGSLLSYCSRIICFSENSKNLLVKAYPLLEGRITVSPHQVDWVRKVNLRRKHIEINIAVIGNIGFSKGADIVSGLAAHIAGSRKKMRIHIFGQIYPGQPANLESNPRVIFHGAYRKTDLPVLMEDYHIDIVFISSIWPETFSYTTEEAIQMEMPVAVFNLGAPVERVREYNKGLILSSTEPASIVREIEDFIKTLEG